MSPECVPEELLGFSLEQMSVPVPCTVAWESMTGSEQVRHCAQCQQQVFNISAMVRKDAEEFLQASRISGGDGQDQGRLCVRFYRRPDGTVITRDCFALRRAFRTGSMWMVGMVAGLLLVVLGIFGWGRKSDGSTDSIWPRICEHEPFRTLFGSRSSTVMGSIAVPTPVPVAPPPTNLPPVQSGNEASE
jgi:hypothetical protein